MPLLRTIIEYNHVAVLGTTPVENFLAFNHCAHQLLSAHQEKFLDRFGPPRLLIFANISFSICKIFKHILQFKGILTTFCVREVYACRKSTKLKQNFLGLSVGIDSAKLYLILEYEFPNYPPPRLFGPPIYQIFEIPPPTPTI